MISAVELTKQGITAYNSSDRAQASQLFRQAIQLDPNYEMAWLWLSAVVDSIHERRTCLERALTINPRSESAKRGLAKLPPPEQAPDQDILPPPSLQADASTSAAPSISTPAQSLPTQAVMVSKPAKRRALPLVLVALLVVFGLSGAAYIIVPMITRSQAESKPTVPEIFKSQLMRFLEEASKADAMTSQGVNYRDLKQQVATVQASFNLIDSTWPAALPSEAREDFRKALQGWGLALDLWELKLNDKDTPVEPNINDYQTYMEYGGNALVTATYPQDYLVNQYRGKKYLPFDENISVLLSVSSRHYEAGKGKTLQILQ